MYSDELELDSTNYFILDSKGKGHRADIDFVQYGYKKSKFNKLKVGDLIINRRSRRASETSEFYFYAAAKIANILVDGDDLTAIYEKVYHFPDLLLQSDLETYKWAWKDRKDHWGNNFFNQYGMNHFVREDFINLLKFVEYGDSTLEYDSEAAHEAVIKIIERNYHVEDSVSLVKTRTNQHIFSREVKHNYGNKCAVCKISTKSFLIGSHIIPWSERKDCRLDPANGICLCVLHDKAFDKGLLTMDEDYKIIISQSIEQDKELNKLLMKLNGKSIALPKNDPPKIEYLKYHRDHIFEKFE